MTISRCKAKGTTVGPYKRLIKRKPRLIEQYTTRGVRAGVWSRYDEEGKRIHQFAYDEQGKLHGEERFYIKGRLSTLVRWVHGKKQGQSCLYHTNGARKSCGQFINGKAHGPWPVWNPIGKLLFTNQYAHGFAHEHMFYGHQYYTLTEQKDDGAIVSKTYQLDSHKLLKSIVYRRCGVGWCRQSYKGYFRRNKHGRLILIDTPIEHMVIDWKTYTMTDQETKKTTKLFCNESQFAPLIEQFHQKVSTCTKHHAQMMQRLVVKFTISDLLSIDQTKLQYASKGTTKVMKACISRRLRQLHSPTIKIKGGSARSGSICSPVHQRPFTMCLIFVAHHHIDGSANASGVS